MYAWISDETKKTWRGMIFAYYGSEQDPYDFHYVVLDADKNHLINVNLYHTGPSRQIQTRVVLIDSGMDDWIQTKNQGIVNFLSGYCASQLAEQISPELLEKCIHLDKQYNYQKIVEVKGATGIENLLEITGYFHDAHIINVERKDPDHLKVFFEPTWGYKLTLFFYGQTSYDLGADPEYNWWLEASLFFEDGYYCLCDGEDVRHFSIKELNCWFRSRKMAYKLEPCPLS